MNAKIIGFIAGGAVLLFVAFIIATGNFSFTVLPSGEKKAAEDETTGAVSADKAEFKTYTNSSVGISMLYPSRWEAVEQGFDDPTVAVMFRSPAPTGYSSFAINVRVQVDKGSGGLTLDNVSNYLLEAHTIQYPSGTMVEEGSTTFAGLPGHKLVFSDTVQEIPGKWTSVWTVKDGTAYILTYTNTQDLYDNIWPLAQEMIQSFEIQ